MNECKLCGEHTSNLKFCSRSCSAKTNNLGVRRHGTGEATRRTCEICSNHSGSKKYCSDYCRVHDGMDSIRKKLVAGVVLNPSYIKKLFLYDTALNSCEMCDIGGVWNGKSITLQLDHINGDRTNNDYSNLRLLCPNCHTQTDTYGSKNRHNPLGKLSRGKRYTRD